MGLNVLPGPLLSILYPSRMPRTGIQLTSLPMSSEAPLVSIITPCFNSARFLEQTIESVLTQDYEPIEYIVIDGGSTDGSLDILKKYGARLQWVSERDSGQSEAINKGFRRARGAIRSWVNADDLLTPGAVRTVAGYFQAHPDVHFLYGDVEAIDEKGRSYGLRRSVQPCSFETLVNEDDSIVQPGAFWRAELWAAIGELDEKLHFMMDYDYWIRASRQFKLARVPFTLARERLYGTAKTFKGGLERYGELESMPKAYGGAGVPQRFKPEVAAGYLGYAWGQARQGHWDEARASFAKAQRIKPPLLRFWIYLVSMMLFGEPGIAWLRLTASRLNSLGRRTPADHAR